VFRVFGAADIDWATSWSIDVDYADRYGFGHRVVVLPDGNLKGTAHMWLVAETMAANTGQAVPLTLNQIPILQAPPEGERERNYGS
jgi:hypothetical protein